MGKMSRDKGGRGEREWARLETDEGFPSYRTCQRVGGPDSPDTASEAGCDKPYHVEVKRVERFRLYDSLDQAKLDAPENKFPVVAHRSNHREWVVVLRAGDFFRLVRESL